jgi:hypothetical protein
LSATVFKPSMLLSCRHTKGHAGEIMAAVGAKPTNIPAGELYTALDRGTLPPMMDLMPCLA